MIQGLGLKACGLHPRSHLSVSLSAYNKKTIGAVIIRIGFP